ncbi:MAG TPA: heterodisulfide reductase-related iron-sulfur binding cluster [Actinomycetes bacterium]|jgi:glycolate oxidase iron-sulfur subunit|nr:heterodisulfide reductase-related iron-sulfur binding cluster [Actinomycetes bacterium]
MADNIAPAFDAFHPPEQELIDDCVHCGFCLPTCPTYVLWGEEMDSPRGRIYLMEIGLQGETMNDEMVRHFDQCLGCMACVTACPSGVQYGKLIEATRQQVERRHPRSRRDRAFRALVFRLFPYPRRLRLLRGPLRVYQRSRLGALLRRAGLLDRLPERMSAMERLLPTLGRMEAVPAVTPAVGQRRRRVGMLTGCVQRVFFPEVNAATARVLAADGCEVVAPPGQRCCGALSLHAGREAEAQAFARAAIEEFEAAGTDEVVVNAAGCGSAMKEYGHLLRDDPEFAGRAAAFSARVRDLSELLVELGPVAPRHPLPITVAWHDACHLGHAQGIRAQPRNALAAIPGLEVREIGEAEICCGSAGIYNLVEPKPATELGDRKAASVLATGADLLVTSNPGCLMQIRTALERRGERLAMAHLAEVLDAAVQGADPRSLLDRR